MRSKFKLVTYFILLFFIFLIGFILYTIPNIEKGFNSVIGAYLTFTLLIVSSIATFYELRDKIILLEFKKSSIEIKRFIGILETQIIEEKKITGFYNSIVKTAYGSYDYIYLMINDKKIAKISNQYHKNYSEMKTEIERKYKNLGFIKTGLLSEFKDFTK